MPDNDRTIFWSNLDEPGCERTVISESDEGHLLSGTILIQLESATEIGYEVSVDAEWLTQAALVVMDDDEGRRTLELVQVEGAWYLDGALLVLGPDCFDVDIAMTPMTNTLPIKRLNLAVGEAADIVVAWVRIPELTVARSEQRYERLADKLYRFSMEDFSADLEVDDFGIVTSYPDGWRAESIV